MALNLGKVLGSTLVAHPSLFQELPGLLAALDEGKQIFLQDSQDPLQHAMIVVLRALPTNCSSKSLWTKGECSSLRSFILDELLTSSYIIQPQNLAVHERLAVISAKSLLHMLENHPEILSDLTSLFENLLDGEGLDLSGLENLELREELISFLRQVGLRNTDGVFQLSEKAEDQSSRKAIKLILSSLRIKSSWNHSPEEAKQVVHVESSQSVEIFSNHQGQVLSYSSLI